MLCEHSYISEKGPPYEIARRECAITKKRCPFSPPDRRKCEVYKEWKWRMVRNGPNRKIGRTGPKDERENGKGIHGCAARTE